jgi:hypothetical protein
LLLRVGAAALIAPTTTAAIATFAIGVVRVLALGVLTLVRILPGVLALILTLALVLPLRLILALVRVLPLILALSAILGLTLIQVLALAGLARFMRCALLRRLAKGRWHRRRGSRSRCRWSGTLGGRLRRRGWENGHGRPFG